MNKEYGSLPVDWLDSNPISLVIGDGPVTGALTYVFEGAHLSFDELSHEPIPSTSGGYPRVLEDLRRAFIVLGNDISVSQALQYHHMLWTWVNRIASAGDQHELSVLLILPDRETAGGLEESLSVGLGLERIDPFTTGHGVWHQGDPFLDLVTTVLNTKPLDFLFLKSRQVADGRRRSLLKLRQAVEKADLASVLQCAREVLKQFEGKAHLLDIFCEAPSHRNGNLLRSWLTLDGPNDDWLKAGREQLPGWIAVREG